MSQLSRLIETNFRDNGSPGQGDHIRSQKWEWEVKSQRLIQNDDKVGVGVGLGIDEAHFKSVVASSNPGLPYRRLRLHDGGALVVCCSRTVVVLLCSLSL